MRLSAGWMGTYTGGMAGMNFFDFQEKIRKPTTRTAAGSAGETEPLTVTQLTGLIERAIKGGVPGQVQVKGEVSNYKHHGSSGHAYFTLKDPNACIDCVMFRSETAKLKFVPGDGMELLASGRVAVYPQRGRYQLYVSALEPLGQGALELAFQQLRAKLEAEGLFRAERKRPLPAYPSRIVIVTSRETAAYQDMLKVLRRFPWVQLALYHVPVQGDGSAEKIAAAIEHLNRGAAGIGGVDLILLGRGGGSLEDLWEFNEEVVARAIAACGIPIITGIGHEVDVSIADLVSDYHAHTPTEAAQVVTAQWRTVKDTIDLLGVRVRRGLRSIVQEARHRLTGIERHEAFRRPLDRINALRQLLDDRQRALMLARNNRLRGWQERLERLSARLGERHPRHLLRLYHERLTGIAGRLERGMREGQEHRRQRLDALAGQLRAVSPEAILQRGYSMTMRKRDGAVVRSATEVRPGERLVTRLADGTVESVVEDAKQLRLFE